VSMGLVVGLAYANPYLDPYEEFQALQTHPDIRVFSKGQAHRVRRARHRRRRPDVVAQAHVSGRVPCRRRSGFLNCLAIKGSHAAIKSGMLAAEPRSPRCSRDDPQTNSTPTAPRAKNRGFSDELLPRPQL